jgi:hypothetical protein
VREGSVFLMVSIGQNTTIQQQIEKDQHGLRGAASAQH